MLGTRASFLFQRFCLLSARSCSSVIPGNIHAPFVQAIQPDTQTADRKQAIYPPFAAYFHAVPLQELLECVERARRDAQLRYVVIYGAACSYCLGRAERLDRSYLRTFAFELREQLAQTLTAFVTSILTQPRRLDAGKAAGPPLRRSLRC
jgi:hypothetical protein